MQINTNLMSMFSSRQLARSESTLSQSIQRLSSGLRVNSAKDDAAGLAIAERMTTQVRGGNQAVRNANDAISMLQTADGAMSTVAESMQRIRELAVQSANATNSATDRSALQAEAAQLVSEITRIGRETEFNGEKLFDQSTAALNGVDTDKGAVIEGLKNGWLSNSEYMIEQHFGILGKGDKMYVSVSNFTDGQFNVLAKVGPPTSATYFEEMFIDMADFTPPNMPNGGTKPGYSDRIVAHEMVHAVMNSTYGAARMNAMPSWFKEGVAELIHGRDEQLAIDIAASDLNTIVSTVAGAWGSGNNDYSSAYVAARYLHDTLKGAGHEGGIKAMMQYMDKNASATLDDAFNALTSFATAGDFIASFTGGNVAVGAAYVQNRINMTNADTGAIGGLDADNGDVRTAETIVGFGGSSTLRGLNVTYEEVGGTTGTRFVDYQIGANAGQKLQVGIGAMNSAALGIRDLDIGSADGSALALVRIDEALNYLNKQRANVGAQLSRMDFSITNLQSNVENTSASRSRIKDADYATEAASLARSQILQQAGMAMLATANSSPQLALQLLRG